MKLDAENTCAPGIVGFEDRRGCRCLAIRSEPFGVTGRHGAGQLLRPAMLRDKIADVRADGHTTLRGAKGLRLARLDAALPSCNHRDALQQRPGLADSRTSTGQCSVSMGLGVLRLLFVPLRLTGDGEVGEQDCMDDDLAEGRTGELIDDQADALPHRLNSPAPLHAEPDQRVLFVAG